MTSALMMVPKKDCDDDLKRGGGLISISKPPMEAIAELVNWSIGSFHEKLTPFVAIEPFMLLKQLV